MATLEPVHWKYLISREHYLDNHGGDLVELDSSQIVGMALGDGRNTVRSGGLKPVHAVHAVHEHEREQNREHEREREREQSRKSDAWQRVELFFQENPDTTLTYRQIADQLGVSVGLISKVKNSQLSKPI
jgi:hypothetical protein